MQKKEDGPITYTKFSQTDFRKKGVGGFDKRKCVNGGTVLFALLNLRARIKILVSTLDTNNSVTDSTQKMSRCFDPEASCSCGQVIQHSSPQTVDESGNAIRFSISLRLAVDYFLLL